MYHLVGHEVSTLDEARRASVRGGRIGFVFQAYNLLPRATAFKNVELPLIYARVPRRERRGRVLEALDAVGLADRVSHLPTQLSGGQQQRVAIARALAGDPKFLLADEPTGNLDSLMARQVMDLLEEINRMGTTIIMVTHDPDLARRAHRNVQIIDGQVTDFKPYEGPHEPRAVVGSLDSRASA